MPSLNAMLSCNSFTCGVSPCSPAASAVPAASSASAWLQPACWPHAWNATRQDVRPGGAGSSTCCRAFSCGRSKSFPHLRSPLSCSSMVRVMMNVASSRRHAAHRCLNPSISEVMPDGESTADSLCRFKAGSGDQFDFCVCCAAGFRALVVRNQRSTAWHSSGCCHRVRKNVGNLLFGGCCPPQGCSGCRIAASCSLVGNACVELEEAMLRACSSTYIIMQSFSADERTTALF